MAILKSKDIAKMNITEIDGKKKELELELELLEDLLEELDSLEELELLVSSPACCDRRIRLRGLARQGEIILVRCPATSR